MFQSGPLNGCVDSRDISFWHQMEADVIMSSKAAADVTEAVLGAVFLASDRNVNQVVRKKERSGNFLTCKKKVLGATKIGVFKRFPSCGFPKVEFDAMMPDTVEIPKEFEELEQVKAK